MRRLAAIFLLAFALTSVTVAAASAQDATPVVPNPELCTLEPVSRETLEMLVASPEADTPVYSESGPGTPVALPSGEPVDAATQERIEVSMIVNVACINTGEPLRQLAVYSEAGIKRLLGTTTIVTDEDYAALQTPSPLDESGWTVIYSVSGGVRLEEDKVAVLIVGDDRSQADPSSATLFILIEVDGHWYIDSFERTRD